MTPNEYYSSLVEEMGKQERLEATFEAIRLNVREKSGIVPNSVIDVLIQDVINEFCAYTNRDEVPNMAIGLVADMVIRRYSYIEDSKKEDSNKDNIKSYSQGNISITYRDPIENEPYKLSDNEKSLMRRFVLSKTACYAKRRK